MKIEGLGRAFDAAALGPAPAPIAPRANAMVIIWLPGGVAQTDTWDPKVHTPFENGVFRALGISANASVVTEGRPF